MESKRGSAIITQELPSQIQTATMQTLSVGSFRQLPTQNVGMVVQPQPIQPTVLRSLCLKVTKIII